MKLVRNYSSTEINLGLIGIHLHVTPKLSACVKNSLANPVHCFVMQPTFLPSGVSTLEENKTSFTVIAESHFLLSSNMHYCAKTYGDTKVFCNKRQLCLWHSVVHFITYGPRPCVLPH